MSSAGEAAPSKNKGEKTIWKVSATIANKRAMRRRGPGEIVMVSGFIPPAPLSKIIAHAQAGWNGPPGRLERMPGKHRKTCCPEYRLRAASKPPDGPQTRNQATERRSKLPREKSLRILASSSGAVLIGSYRFRGLILPQRLQSDDSARRGAEYSIYARPPVLRSMTGYCLSNN
jgi:hypothetical protein